MPRIPRGHTNLPTMMIAEKAAELISLEPTGDSVRRLSAEASAVV